ncbi:hypothetical protein TL16_g04788 [Triparma laevis f. inornata]|nr:hypothetical protein TL16_g04788 [Triparma laevis f. inornata]
MDAMLPLLCPCLLQILNPSLHTQKTTLQTLTTSPLSFQRKRQGVFTSGTYENVSITFQIVSGTWCGVLIGINVLPKSTGKGRVINISDIGSIIAEGNSIVIKGKSNDLLFHGFSEGDAAGITCSQIKSCIDYSIKNNPENVETSLKQENSLENKSALQKQVYFAKKEMELTAKR